MRFSQPKREEISLGVSIAPLIDIVFLLLIFFMLTSHIEILPGIDISLPDITERGSDTATETVIVALDREGNYYLNEIEEADKLREYFNTEESKLCIFRKRNFENFIEKNKDLQLYIFYDKQIGSREIILAGNYCPIGDSLLQKLENDTNITNSQDQMEVDKEETD